ncbi:MAG: DUF4198 domain-containing protein [Proteobacteria bacterium]|jgi:uncharacterized GH25 family protein|nr:DUF4198 domain-containing protein [Pseudomonadota bacterium]
MARKLWINVYESFALHKSLTHPPRHFIVSLGFGHVLPMDDFLVTTNESILLAMYDLVDPGLKKTALPMPVKTKDVIQTDSGMTVECGDMAIRKISLNDKTKPGTYQVVATTREDFFTMYLDESGKPKMVNKALDEMKGVGNIVRSVKFQAFAKGFMAVEKWTDPKPLGHALELMPLTDLSNIHIGDPVSFQVALMGKPFSCTQETMEYMTAASNTFGGEASGDPEGFFLSAYLVNSRARFWMPTAGQWVVNVFASQYVTPESSLKELVGKCTMVYYGSSISFNVKP